MNDRTNWARRRSNGWRSWLVGKNASVFKASGIGRKDMVAKIEDT